MAGIIDPIKGIVHLSNPMYINSAQPLAEEIRHKYNIPVIVENDAHCCCWGELVYRKGLSRKNFLTILGEFRATNIIEPEDPGIAIGLGLVIGGKVYYGDNYRTGEFQSVDWRQGSLTQFSLSYEDSHNITENKKILTDVFHELAKNIALLINICDFNSIILAGDIIHYKDQITPIFNEAINYNWLYKHIEPRKVSVETFPFDEHAVAFGAASCALMRIFSIPDYTGQEGILRGTLLLKDICPIDKKA
jgi:predicted NBD/HSP70 family sugar kinase